MLFRSLEIRERGPLLLDWLRDVSLDPVNTTSFLVALNQRLQRDVETLKGHVMFDWDRTAELAGRYALGFGLRPTDMV